MEFKPLFLPLLIIVHAVACQQNQAPTMIDAPSISQPPGLAIAGYNYTIECSINVTGLNNHTNISWISGDDVILSGAMRTVQMFMMMLESSQADNIYRYYSTLIFTPLRASDSGTYTCKAILGDTMNMKAANICIDVSSKDESLQATVHNNYIIL